MKCGTCKFFDGDGGNLARGEEEQLVFALEQNAYLKGRLGMAENRAELLAEDIECMHMALDKADVPRTDGDNGPVLSMWGRVLRFKETPSNAALTGAEGTVRSECYGQHGK